MPGNSLLGVNMRVTGHFNQGGRKYMEDVFSVAYQQSENGEDLEYAFIGIFDGHGGKEAALFAKENLMDNITKSPNFWSDNDDLVLKSIREGFLKTQQDMWADIENWAKTGSGMRSTAGTTASVAFIRRSKIYIGHVGDSGIILGEQHPDKGDAWKAQRLTVDHKPESEKELARIEASGGKVINKNGVPRVVWTRPQKGHTGPVRRSTPLDEIPFLAVARALGDLWSYNSKKDEFIVTPEPDLHVYDIDISKHRCLVFGTDGAWNVLSPESAVSHVQRIDKLNERYMMEPDAGHPWKNPAKELVDEALAKWNAFSVRADNTTTVVVLLDPPGPPRAQVLRRQKELAKGGASAKKPCNNSNAPPLPPRTEPKKSRVSIISRTSREGRNMMKEVGNNCGNGVARIVHDSLTDNPKKVYVPTSKTQNKSKTVKSENLQVNEVTSSDIEDNKSSDKDSARKSVSRELANLKMESPAAACGLRSRRSTQIIGSSAAAAVITPLRQLKSKGRRSIEGLGHEDSDSENLDEIVKPLLPVNSGALEPLVTAEPLVPVSKLVEVEKKFEDLSRRLKKMESKVAKQEIERRAQKSTSPKAGDKSTKENAQTTPSRVLRARNHESPTNISSATKRKISTVSSKEHHNVPAKKRKASPKSTSKVMEMKRTASEATNTRHTRKSLGSITAVGLKGNKLRRRKIY